jgi:phosphoglycolate phosphatase
MIRLVVTDMDNTLYSWVDYVVPAVEAMVDSVCRSTALPKIRVIQALKTVYEKYESNEYPYVLQESSLFAEYPDFGSFDKLVIQPAQEAFRLARRRYLQPYPRVLETLETLRRKDIPVVALTDAPRNPAELRAKHLQVDALLRALYTLPGFHFPADGTGEVRVATTIVQKQARGAYRAACPVIELPRDAEKPVPTGLLRICQDFNVEPSQVLLVGDSLRKDMGLAKSVGAVGCWAEYGTYVSLEYRERLDIISARSITARHAASLHETELEAVTGTHRLSNFQQLLEFL